MKQGTETDLYEQVERYLRLKHPSVVHHWDLSGLWTPSHKARNLYGRLNRRAWPDLFIAQPVMYDGTVNPCAGLFLELKCEGTKLKRVVNAKKILKGEHRLRLAGDWWDQHIEEQAAMLDDLRSQGYYAEFGVGYDMATMYIDCYLGGVFTPNVSDEADESPF